MKTLFSVEKGDVQCSDGGENVDGRSDGARDGTSRKSLNELTDEPGEAQHTFQADGAQF